MNKCLRITFSGNITSEFLHNYVQKQARKLALEGTAQRNAQERIKIIVCGSKEGVDKFVDALHKGTPKVAVLDLEIEPYLKDKDYRGVFRVIE